MADRTQATVDEVRRFWDANPLFAGESSFEVGSRDFFEEHKRFTVKEFSGEIAPVFLKDVHAGSATLDVGCGIGFWVHEFCNRGAKVTACDLTARAVTVTKGRSSLYGLKVDISQANAEQLPFADSSFDHINCQGVIHHTPDTAACIREFHRVLRPGGTACFSVYYRALPLRSHSMFRLVTKLAGPLIRMRGRGRESMMSSSSPEELVRMYDGAENPLGKSYTRAEIEQYIGKQFSVLEVALFSLPRRVLPFGMPDSVHRILASIFGLMIVFRCNKPRSDEKELR